MVGELAELTKEAKIGPVGGEQGAVDGQNDKGPNSGDGVDDRRIVSEGGKGVGAGDESEDRGDKNGGSECDVFALLPIRALVEGLGSCGRQPEEQAFDGMGGVHGAATWPKVSAEIPLFGAVPYKKTSARGIDRPLPRGK
jgi:hypothetical protein